MHTHPDQPIHDRSGLGVQQLDQHISRPNDYHTFNNKITTRSRMSTDSNDI
jgi:hypothetical protein